MAKLTKQPPSDVFDQPDPAAIAAIIISLDKVMMEENDADRINLSETYNGGDQYLREVYATAASFEAWACKHVRFTEIDAVWPYLLQDEFGACFLRVLPPTCLPITQDESHELIAVQLGIPFDNYKPEVKI